MAGLSRGLAEMTAGMPRGLAEMTTAGTQGSMATTPLGALPRIFVATDGQDLAALPDSLDAGLLLRDLDLASLIRVADGARRVLAVDLDSIEGLNPDGAAARFVTRQLGIEIVASRRPSVVADVMEQGCLGLLRILAFDSTGLGRALDGHELHAGVGSLVSPGPVVAHLGEADLARLPRPLLAYGLIDSPARAAQLLIHADCVIVRAECAAGIGNAASLERLPVGAGRDGMP